MNFFSFVPTTSFLVLWIAISGLVAFVLMGYDKLLAKIGKSRMQEKSLWFVSAMGGFAGICLGAIVFHHKTAKRSFWPPVILSLGVWLALIYVVSKLI